MFEKVSRSLKYDSNFFFVHKHIYMDTTTDHFTPLALRMRGKKLCQDAYQHLMLHPYITVICLSRRMVQIGQERLEAVLYCGAGSSGGKNVGGAISSRWWNTALAVSPGGLPNLATFFCPLALEVYSKC